MNDLLQLHYRRQFLLADSVVYELQNWEHRKVGQVHLFVHPDLEVTGEEGPSNSIVLLGYFFDPAHPTKTNAELISDIIVKVNTFSDLVAAIKPFAGRYALIYRDKTTFAILHDPLGLREIYYCTQPNRVICGSQPNLLDAFSEPQLGVTRTRLF